MQSEKLTEQSITPLLTAQSQSQERAVCYVIYAFDDLQKVALPLYIIFPPISRVFEKNSQVYLPHSTMGGIIF